MRPEAALFSKKMRLEIGPRRIENAAKSGSFQQKMLPKAALFSKKCSQKRLFSVKNAANSGSFQPKIPPTQFQNAAAVIFKNGDQIKLNIFIFSTFRRITDSIQQFHELYKRFRLRELRRLDAHLTKKRIKVLYQRSESKLFNLALIELKTLRTFKKINERREHF